MALLSAVTHSLKNKRGDILNLLDIILWTSLRQLFLIFNLIL